MPEGRVDYNIFDEEDKTPAAKSDLSATGFDIFTDGAEPSTPAPSPRVEPFSESNTLYGHGTAQTFLGEIGAGLQQGTRQVLSTPPGLAAMALRSFDSTHATQLMEMSQQIADGGAQRGIAKIEDMTGDPFTWARYAGGTLGESVPFLLSVLGGGAGARLFSGMALRSGAPLATRKLLESTAPEAFGAFATASGIETAATLQELYKAKGEIDPTAALIAGTAKGALEAAFPLILSRQMGLTVGQAGGLYDRMLERVAGAAKTRAGRTLVDAGVEGATELAQEEIDIATRNFMDENYPYFSPETNSRRINALVGGALGGASFAQIPGFHTDEAISDQAVRNAALDAPILYGAGYNEMPSTGPEDMVRNSHEGLDGTAGLAIGELGDQLLAETDLRKRGLYAAVIPGRDTTFGTQDQANNDHGYYGGAGFVRLDPSRITRGDVTASIEDVPSTVADPRVEFKDQANVKEASDALVETIKLKEQARRETSVQKREAILTEAALQYRKAVNLGARVEPFTDGQVILRDEGKVQSLVEAQSESVIRPQVTDATTFETRTRPDGGQILIFKKGPTKNRKKPGGQALDLENVNPDHITALPTPELARQVLASQAVAGRLSLPAARGKGIRFVEGTPNQPMLLGQLVKVLTALTSGKAFSANKEPVVERFMALVDAGLRVDVTASTGEFALLRKAGKRELQDPTREIVGQEYEGDPETGKLVKSRAKRQREPAVSRKIAFSNSKVELVFYTQFRASYFTEVVTGTLEGGEGKGEGYSQKGSSPLVETLRDLAKNMQLKTDFVIQIVAPGEAGTSGVKYENVESQLTPSGKPQKRTVISVDPWHFSTPTQGQKPLTSPRQKMNYAVKGDKAYQVARITKKTNDTMVNIDGKKVQLREWLQQQTQTQADETAVPGGPTHILLVFNDASGLATPLKVGTEEQFKQEMSDLGAVSVGELSSKPVKDYLSGVSDIVPPEQGSRERSRTALYAKSLGVPETKRFTSEEQVTRFWTEFSYNIGKVIIDFEWGNLSQGEKDGIQQAWRRETFIARSLSRQNAIARVVAHPLMEAALGNRGRKEQFYQFEEWLTQNIARTLADPDSKIGAVEKFFRFAGNRVANFLRSIKKYATDKTRVENLDPRQGAPSDVVKSWVDMLYERGRTRNEPSFLEESTRQSLLASINANQKDLGGMNLEYAVATPQRASSVQIRKLLEIIDPKYVEDINKLKGLIAWSDHINTTLEWTLGIHQLAELNPHIPQLAEYVSNVRAMENEATSWSTMADNRLREIKKLGRVQEDALWKFMADLDNLIYQDKDKLKKGEEKPRWPTADELLALVRKHKLNKAAFGTYTKVRQDYLSFLSYLEMVGIRNAEEFIQDDQARQEKIKEIQGDVAQMRGRPYFPHMRFGLHAVTVKNNRGETVHFSTYDTKKQRAVAIRGIISQFKVPQENRIIEDEISPVLQHYQGLPGFALNNVKEALGLNAEVLTESQKRDSDLLDSMALDAAPITSFRQNLRERSNTPGFSMDGARSYANYFARSAKFVSRMAYTNQLQQTIKDIRSSASPVSKDTRTRIADYVQRHYESEMNPAGDLAGLRSLAFSWYFAFVPAAAFINLTQVPLVSWPYLAGKFGDLSGTLNLGKAFGDNTKDFWDRFRGREVKDTPKQEAIDQAHDDRLLDDGFATELAAIANGSVLSRTIAGSKASKAVRHIAQWGAAPFSMAERTNRSVTFRAAYDLALANPDHPFVREVMVKNKAEADRLRIDRGWTEQQISAYLVGAQAVRDTQFEYSRWARPKLMSGGRGMLLMFKTYLQNMLFFMFKSNRGVQARFMLTMLAAAGVMGLPGADDAEEIAKWIGKQLGYDLNPQNEIRALLKNFTDSPDIFLHGASRVGFGLPAILHGLGIPMATPDVSASLSMGKLIPGLSALLNPQSSKFSEMVGDVTADLLGPAVGVPLSMYQALTDMSLPADDPKRWERALPRALKSAVRSSRYLAEQRERDRTGGTVVQFDPNDWSDQMDAASVSLGLNPAKVSRQWDYIQAQKEAQTYWTTRRSILMTEYGRARRLKDREAAQDAVKDIKEYNRDLPYKGLKITADQVRESLSSRTQSLKKKEAQVPNQKYLRPLAKGIGELYPESQSREDRRKITIHERTVR